MKNKFLLIFLIIFFSFGTMAADQKCDDSGCYDICTADSGCTAPNGCYTTTAENFEGSSWQSVLSGNRKENGTNCTGGVDAQCKSANCEWRCDEWNTDGNGNNTTCKTDHHECADLKVCRKAQAGETLADSSRLCENGLIPSDNKCIVASSIPYSEEGTVSTISEVTIDPNTCTMKIPAGMNSTYRYNIYMTQLLEFLFEDPQFGGDADCLAVTKGVTHITQNLKNVRTQFSQGIVQGLREQEEKFLQAVQNHSDVTKQDSVDMYMQSLKAIIENQKKYKEQNTNMQNGFVSAKYDFIKLNEYYFGGFDWGSDAKGDTPNRTRAYTLSDGWHAGVRDGVGVNYCRGRSPELKNSWKRRYRQAGTPADLAFYLKLPIPPNNDSGWNQFWDNVGDEVKNNPQGVLFGSSSILINSLVNDYKGDVFLLDPVLPRNGVEGDYFSKFGKTDWTNTFDGDVRQMIDGNLSHNGKTVNEMLDYYVGFLYKKFKEDPTVLGKISDADKAKINEISVLMMSPTIASSLSPGFIIVEVSADDAKKKYFITADAQNKFIINESQKKFIDLALTKNFSSLSIKHVVNFHKLIWDFRQRMYLLQYLYSANGGRRHPVELRGTFFEAFASLLQYNTDYLNSLNTGHDKAIACLENLKIKYQAAVQPDGTLISSPTNYDPKAVPAKPKTGHLTEHKFDCKGGKCNGSNISANLNIPTFNAKSGNNALNGNSQNGNLKNSQLSAFGAGLKAINENRKKTADKFFKTASINSKKAVEGNRRFIKSSLTVPAAIASAIGPDNSNTGAANLQQSDDIDKKNAKTEEKVALGKIAPIKVAPVKPPNSLQLNGNEINNPDAEEMLKEVSKESNRAALVENESDSIFTKISKSYMRAGLPRLLKKQANPTDDEHEFQIDKTKKPVSE